MTQYTKDPKRKYHVKVYSAVYCTSHTDYFAKAVITGGGKRETRDIDLSGCRIICHDAPFTYKGYPQYVRRSIISQLKQMSDEGELSVFEHDRDGNRRYHDLRYHHPDYLKSLINKYFSEVC